MRSSKILSVLHNKGKESKAKQSKGTERKGKERKGKERKGKERDSTICEKKMKKMIKTFFVYEDL